MKKNPNTVRIKTNPIAKVLPQFKHKRFKDKTKYNRQPYKALVRDDVL